MNQLTDLPNIGNTLADKLKSVGIETEQDLKEVGSENAIIRIASLDKSGACINMLYALEELGYHVDLETYRKKHNLDYFGVGRVISEHKERYVVRTIENEFDAEIIGNLRFSAHNRSDFPAVGDWVAISQYDENQVLIHSVFPRKTLIERQAVGQQGEKQIIATNIDYALIVLSVGRDFNLNRLERYLTICHTSKVKPIIILNKIDLIEETDISSLVAGIHDRAGEAPVVAISNDTLQGVEELKQMLIAGKTYCMLGSSGVGKSTLINNLTGKELMKTNTISLSTNKGRHVTTHRELTVLAEGGIIIDNPGIREVGISDSAEGLEMTFSAILNVSEQCRFSNCSHVSERGCAVVAAVERGEIDKSSYENYLKMEREKEHFESTLAEKRKKDKDFGKMVKHFKNIKKPNKY